MGAHFVKGQVNCWSVEMVAVLMTIPQGCVVLIACQNSWRNGNLCEISSVLLVYVEHLDPLHNTIAFHLSGDKTEQPTALLIAWQWVQLYTFVTQHSLTNLE
mmetsp:Transcript_18099/g.33724  ORF Transcript_18099/g.33724 Transcript_18099/m.33724 type:complete len:102 (-) Transcript_18099:276-581(-)